VQIALFHGLICRAHLRLLSAAFAARIRPGGGLCQEDQADILRLVGRVRWEGDLEVRRQGRDLT